MPEPVIISTLIRLDGNSDWKPEVCSDTPKQVVFQLDSASSDAAQIIARIQQFATAYGKSPCIFAFARCLIRDITVNNARRAYFSRVAAFVLDKCVYVPDPRGAEFVRSPVQMIQEFQKNGCAKGDCDDMVLLANSLFSALGFETRVLAVALPGAATHNHVLSQVKIAGVWNWFDPCNKDNPSKVWTGDILYSL